MAVNIVSQLHDHIFTSELTQLAFTADTTEVPFRLMDAGGAVLLDTVYYPDPGGGIIAHGLNRILDDHIGDDEGAQFSIEIGGEHVRSFKAFKCPVAVETPAETFLFNRFMTSVADERDTAVGRHECLSLYNPDGLPLTVTASYLTYEGKLTTKSFTDLVPVDPSMEIAYYNVSPIRFNDFTIGELVGFVVSCGARTQRYRVLMAPPQHDPALIFRNCFNCWETIFLCGIKETDVNFTRSAAMVNGKFLNYDVDEVISYKASTGPMRYGSDRLARDLARSPAIFLLRSDGTPGERITITDCDVKTNNADDHIPSFSFTYRKASLISTDFEAPAPYRIFDNTFDLTYE